jgi:N-acetylglucosaminyl-diphospho-decaprenol L-rhamnosyltransferase
MSAEVVVIIVGFRNASDIACCLRALSRCGRGPRFDVCIAENGGPEGWAALREVLLGESSPCRDSKDMNIPLKSSPGFPDECLSLPRALGGDDAHVYLREMPENLGYAGAINACLRSLMEISGWQAAWILNPDTEPMPSALFELADHANRSKKGMIGSLITSTTSPEHIRSRGLGWRKVTARTISVDRHTTAAVKQSPSDMESRLDAPDGASIFITRDLIERMGLMDERYFLYFEDIDWGLRAKSLGELGYADRSIVLHKGGTTTGSSGTRKGRSRLAVYLEFRNRLLFVRERHLSWLPWTVLMQAVHIATYVTAGSFTNTLAALRGTLAGLRGESGRPDSILEEHEALRAGSQAVAGGRRSNERVVASSRSGARIPSAGRRFV